MRAISECCQSLLFRDGRVRILTLKVSAFLLEQVLVPTTNVGMHAWKPHLQQVVLDCIVSVMPADTIQVLLHLAVDQVNPSIMKLILGGILVVVKILPLLQQICMGAPLFVLVVVLGLALLQMPECWRERAATLVECESMEGIADICVHG